MKNRKLILLIIFVIFLSTVPKLSASTFFSGYAGGKLNFGGNPAATKYDPDLTLQAFFAGQFNFSENIWSHAELSIDTDDFIDTTIFNATTSLLQIDELSFIFRGSFDDGNNYFSAYMGTYDPIGSDVFLQRYFGIDPIGSHITESYLGLAGSILYPHFGFGISDIIKFYEKPIAVGGYLYLNKEKQITDTTPGVKNEKDIYVLNADFRFASVLRYLTCDLAFGLGAPLATQQNYDDLIVAIDKLYWHFGATMLIGNNYTTSLFIQTGFNGTFQGKHSLTNPSPEKLYILFEPRFLMKNVHLNLSVFSLPKDTVDKLLLVDDCLGVDVNLYNDDLSIGSKTFSLGTHVSLSVKNRTLLDLGKGDFFGDGISANVTPYISTDFLSGEMHAQVSVKVMEFTKNFANAISLDLGYRTRF